MLPPSTTLLSAVKVMLVVSMVSVIVAVPVAEALFVLPLVTLAARPKVSLLSA